MNARYRPVFFAVAALVTVWLAAAGGYVLSQHFKMTAEKVRAYLQETDLEQVVRRRPRARRCTSWRTRSTPSRPRNAAARAWTGSGQPGSRK